MCRILQGEVYQAGDECANIVVRLHFDGHTHGRLYPIV